MVNDAASAAVFEAGSAGQTSTRLPGQLLQLLRSDNDNHTCHKQLALSDSDMLKTDATATTTAALSSPPFCTTRQRRTITVDCEAMLSGGGKAGAATELSFRRIARLVVGGEARACRSIFGSSLNESRANTGAYSHRFFLNHQTLERAFDDLAAAGFALVASHMLTPANGPNSADEAALHRYHTLYVFQEEEPSERGPEETILLGY